MSEFDAVTGLAKGSFGIATFRRAGGKPFPAIVMPGGVVFDVSSEYTDTHAIFDDWQRAFDRLHDLAQTGGRESFEFEALEALPPLAHPNMLCAGSNYRQHVAEMMTHNKFNQDKRLPGESDDDFFKRNYAEVDRRAREGMPFFWTGLHSSLAGANDDVAQPLVGHDTLDWELELGVVLCGSGRYLRPDETDQLIAGYVMVNDIGTVGEFRRADVRWQYDWVSKHQPNFKPAGPFIVPKQFVMRDEMRIKLAVNGETRQDWPVTDMIFTEHQILSFATERIRLLPGDLLLTGSPPGNGAMHGQFLNPGDVMTSEITYLGRQRNHIVAEDAGGRQPTYGPFKTEW